MALVTHERRSATVKGLEDGYVFVLNEITFYRLLTKKVAIQILPQHGAHALPPSQGSQQLVCSNSPLSPTVLLVTNCALTGSVNERPAQPRGEPCMSPRIYKHASCWRCPHYWPVARRRKVGPNLHLIPQTATWVSGPDAAMRAERQQIIEDCPLSLNLVQGHDQALSGRPQRVGRRYGRLFVYRLARLG